jgi:transposase-like protein
MRTESDSGVSVDSVGVGPTEGRRLRFYPLDLKRRIVEETFGPGQSVSIVARRHDVNANLVFAWRKRYRDGTLGKGKVASKATTASRQDLVRIGVIGPGSRLDPLSVVSGSSARSSTVPHRKEPVVRDTDSPAAASIIDIELPNRVKLRFPAAIEEAALRLVLAVTRQLP